MDLRGRTAVPWLVGLAAVVIAFTLGHAYGPSDAKPDEPRRSAADASPATPGVPIPHPDASARANADHQPSTTTPDTTPKEDKKTSMPPPQDGVSAGWSDWVFATGQGLSGLLKDAKWVLLILIVLFVARLELTALLGALASRVKSSRMEVSFQGAGGFQVKFDSPSDTPGQVTISSAGSALDLDDTARLDPAALSNIAEHITFAYTSEAAVSWARRDPEKAAAATEARDRARKCLDDALNDANARGIPVALVGYATALEEARFLAAESLAELYDRDQRLSSAAASLKGTDRNVVLCALGVARALRSEWLLAENVLEPLVTPDPPYLPAAGTYLCSRYNRLVMEVFGQQPAAAQPMTATEFLNALSVLTDRLRRAAGAGPWQGPQAGYQQRELYCCLGIVLSSAAEVAPADERTKWLTLAEQTLKRCTLDVLGEPPMPRDFNNYADLLRQLGQPERALAAIEQARRCPTQWDPAYAETYALILHQLKRRIESLLAIQEYDEQRAIASNPSDLKQYLLNQLLHAQLLFRHMQADGVNDMHRIIEILERARHVLQENAARLSPPDVLELNRSLDEALGDAYLQTVWDVRLAEEAFGRVATYGGTPESTWRHTLSLARGHLRLAKLNRQNYDSNSATEERRRAERLLDDHTKMVDVVPIASPASKQAHDRLLLHFDRMDALHELAYEALQQGDVAVAQPLPAAIDELFRALQGALIREPPGFTHEHEQLVGRLRHAECRQNCLKGRLVAAHASSWTPALVAEVQARFAEARHGHAPWNEHMDLQLGQILMDAALRGEGDLARWHELAMAAFERVMLSDDRAHRQDAMRAYAEALQQRGAILDRQRSLNAKRS